MASARTDWQGVFTPIVTPFTADGAFDEVAVRKIIDQQIAERTGELRRAALILLEKIAHMEVCNRLEMGLKFFPGVSRHRTSPIQI